MNSPIKSISTVLIIIIVILLLIGIPFANRFIPYTDTFSGFVDVWRVNPKDDPHYNYRLNIIIAGFLLSGTAFIILLLSISKTSNSFLLNSMLFLLVFSLGIKNYPYWANGLNYAKHGAGEGGYDPKAMLPMTYFGETWRSIVAIFYLISFVIIATIIIRQFILFTTGKENPWRKWPHFVVLVLLIASFFLTPNYLSWLAD